MTHNAVHDELDCITRAAAMWRSILEEADRNSWLGLGLETLDDPEDEIREQMPWLLARLSPEARDIIGDHLTHCETLVAFVHRRERHLGVVAER